jgi:hypothetical protein
MADSGDLRIMVTNGDRLPCEGVTHHVPLRIGEEDFPITCFRLDLGGFDLVLCIDYLHTLGPIP